MSRHYHLGRKAPVTVYLIACLLSAGCGGSADIAKRKFLASGRRYYSLKRYREASIMFRSAVKRDAKLGEAYYWEGLSETKLGKGNEAVFALRRAIELMPEGAERVDARIRLGDVLMEYLKNVNQDKQLMQEVETAGRQLVALDPQSFDGHRLVGLLLAMRARNLQINSENADVELQTAIAELEKANALRPLRPAVTASLARAYVANRRPDAAEKLLSSVITANRALSFAYSELFQFYGTKNRLTDAEKILKLGIKNIPGEVGFRAQLARFYAAQGRRKEMGETLEQLTYGAKTADAYAMAGDLYLQNGQFEEAIRKYDDGITAAPGPKVRFQRLKVNALLALGRNAEAMALNDSVLKDNPDDAAARIQRAVFQAGSGDVPSAIAELERIIQASPNNPAAHFQIGRLLVSVGQREEARVHLKEALKWAPAMTDALVAMAKIQLATGEYGNAVITADKILSSDERNFEARRLRAVGLRELGQFADSRAELSAALKLDSGKSEALYELGVLDVRERKYKEAEETFVKSYRQDPANLRPLLAVADRFMTSHDERKALATVEDEVQKYPDRTDLRFALGDLELRAGRPDEAKAAFEWLVTKLQGNPGALGKAYQGIAIACRKQGNLAAAVSWQEKAHQVAPDDPLILFNLANLEDASGQTQQAQLLYERTRKVWGNNEVVLNNLAYYVADGGGGDLDQALNMAQRAHQMAPKVPEFADTVALIYFKKNLVDQSLEILEKLVAVRPTDAMFRYHLAMALVQKGEKAKASKELKGALANNPSPADSMRIRGLIAKVGG